MYPMLYTKKKHIDDIIVETLAQYPNTSGPVLLALIQKERPHTTKQAMYYALEYLLDSEVVVKHKQTYSISTIWKLRVQTNLIKQSSDITSILELTEGESISLKFPSLLTADFYWAHIFADLTDWIPKNDPIFFCLAHEWFIIGREITEKTVLENFVIKNKKAYYSIYGKTELDKDFQKTYTSPNLSINTGAPALFGEHVYVNIFKDILIEVFISKDLAKYIHDFYVRNQVSLRSLSKDVQQQFVASISKKYPVRIKISKDTEKTFAIKKKLAKTFVIPQDFHV